MSSLLGLEEHRLDKAAAFPPLDEKLMSGQMKPSLPSALRWWCPAKWTGSG